MKSISGHPARGRKEDKVLWQHPSLTDQGCALGVNSHVSPEASALVRSGVLQHPATFATASEKPQHRKQGVQGTI